MRALKWIGGIIAFITLVGAMAPAPKSAGSVANGSGSVTTADIYYAMPRNDNWSEQQRTLNSVQRRIERPSSCSVQVLRTRNTTQYVRSC